MTKAARFQVDPKLAALLGEGYRSSEEALRELVDNAWDAEATRVEVTLPGELDASPIVIVDDGAGMTPDEVREEYLRIASDRRTRKGDRTPNKARKVRGRKGIGKFAGLMAADEMRVETNARGKCTTVVIKKAHLLAARAEDMDLEAVVLPLDVEPAKVGAKGTRITLSGLNQRFAVPSAEKLRGLLVREYGRESEFAVFVDGVAAALADVPGAKFEKTFEIEGVGTVTVRFIISEQPMKHSGLAVRVAGKLVGKASSVGLEDDPLIPPQLLKRVYGEIEADGLQEHVTADWGAIVENSKAFQAIRAQSAAAVKKALERTFKKELNLAKARWEKELKRRLSALPEHRRQFAEETITRIVRKLYGLPDERIEAVVSVALDAFEKDEYWQVLQRIDAATQADVVRLASVLGELGLVEVALVARQASHRLVFLTEFERLLSNPDTREREVHEAIENNLWLLGSGYRVIASNKTTARIVADYLDRKFVGERAGKRPDLLGVAIDREHVLLVELKRPSHTIGRDDENQAEKYRDDIQPLVPDLRIDVLLVGGSRDSKMTTHYQPQNLRVTTYAAMAVRARDDLGWLLEQLES